MRRTTIPDEEMLFDLPLAPVEPPVGGRARPPQPSPEPEPAVEAPAAGRDLDAETEPPSLFGRAQPAGAGVGDDGDSRAEAAADDDVRPDEEGSALPRRFAAGAIDLALTAATLGMLVTGVALMGLPVRLGQAPAYLLTLGLFSFLYHVVSLALWGQTPGMAYEGLRARGRDGQPLTFGQAARRWMGAVATTLLLGLPTLLSLLDGGSLADRMSASSVDPVDSERR